MKYYVFSPRGRTGSKRIVGLLSGKYKFTIMNNEFFKDNRKDVSRQLNNAKDGDVVHSHFLLLPKNLEDWTIILTQRKSKAEQIMSFAISEKLLDGYNVGRFSQTIEPFSLDEETVKAELEKIKNGYQKFYNTMNVLNKSYVTIDMENTLEEISEKLPIKHDKEIASKLDVRHKSKHNYKDIITNYQEIFNWCGELSGKHLTLNLFDKVSNFGNRG